jgi:hypothetical protein
VKSVGYDPNHPLMPNKDGEKEKQPVNSEVKVGA